MLFVVKLYFIIFWVSFLSRSHIVYSIQHMCLADEITKGRYEYVLTTHIDRGHIHNHLIFCAASFVDYKKYISNKKSYYEIRNFSDKLCKEYNLSVVTPGQSKGKSYVE